MRKRMMKVFAGSICWLVLVCAAIAACPQPVLQTSSIYETGGFARSIASADFDLDGDIDIIATNRFSQNMPFFLNTGSGLYEYGGIVSAVGGQFNRIVITTDIDQDGDVDLAVCNGGVSYFLNLGLNASGQWLGFSPSFTMYAGPDPHWIDAGDVDGDGTIDLVVAAFGTVDATNRITLFRGTGDGTFFGPMYWFLSGTPLQPISITLADVNNDQTLDVVVLVQSTTSPSVWIYPNMGQGKTGWNGLGVPIVIPVALGGRSVTQGDLDNDGDIDFIVAHRASGVLTLLVNEGNVQFATTTLQSTIGCEHAVPVDVDGDGDLDLAIAIREQHQLELWTNQGGDILTSTPFALALSVASGGQEPKFVGIADVDGDGDIDFLIPNSKPSGQGPLAVITNDTPQGPACTSDLNCDGWVDVTDLLWIIDEWGTAGTSSDLDGDGVVAIGDLLLAVASWGLCP